MPPEHWTARFSRPIIFVIITLIAIGVYLAFTIPVAVFPSTDFPRIVVGIDNGVAPINQMEVTVTRPIEEAMNSVPGLESGPLHHQPRFRGSEPVLQLERRHVPDPAICERGAGACAADLCPPTAKLTANRLTFAAFPDPGLQPDFGHAARRRSCGSLPTTPSSRVSTA